MTQLTITNLTQIQRGQTLFKITRLSAQTGDRIGLIGRNGVGKSTLAKLICGVDSASTGRINVDSAVTYVPQMVATHDKSGGQAEFQRIRTALMAHPAALILDEPSANLDENHQAQLIKELQQYPGLLIVISHDRHLLNAVATRIWALKEQHVTVFEGNFEQYQDWANHRYQQQLTDYERDRRQHHRLQATVNERKNKANQIRQGKGMTRKERGNGRSLLEKTAGKMERNAKKLAKRADRQVTPEKPFEDQGIKVMATDLPPFTGKTVVSVRHLTLSRGTQRLLRNANVTVKPGERVAITGPNGSGKTTLLHRIVTREDGIHLSDSAQIGYFQQDLTELTGSLTVLQTVLAHTKLDENRVRQVMGALGLPAQFYDQPVHSLSGGELVKVQLVQVITGNYNVLILDEPTNFLDMSAIGALQNFLSAYPGTVIFVSHDMSFREAVATRELSIQNQQLIDPTLTAVDDTLSADQTMLRFKIDQMMLAEEVDWDEIRRLRKMMK